MRKTGIAIAAGIAIVAGSLGLHGLSENAKAQADDPDASVAAFLQLATVMSHPRCANCHPRGDSPTQGDDMRPHVPPIKGGADGRGATLKCTICHVSTNNDSTGTPGVADWHLAPAAMGWAGLTPAELCTALTTAESNGGMTPEEIATHMAEDQIVAWAWNPGKRPGNRERAVPPVDYETFKQAAHTWASTGAHCPAAEAATP